MPSNSPDDEAVRRAKHEQSESVRLLGKTGARDFDLPLHWLTTDDDDAESRSGDTEVTDNSDASGGGGDVVRGRNDDAGGEEGDLSSSDSDMGGTAFPRRCWPRASGRSADPRNVITVRVGSFALLVAKEAPFVVGKILAESAGDD